METVPAFESLIGLWQSVWARLEAELPPPIIWIKSMCYHLNAAG